MKKLEKFTENIKNSAIYKYSWKGIDQLSGKDDWKIEWLKKRNNNNQTVSFTALCFICFKTQLKSGK